MKRSLFALLFFVPIAVSAQEMIGKTRAEVATAISQQALENHSIATPSKATDTLLTSVSGEGLAAVRKTYRIDASGHCISETWNTACDSCMHESLQRVLEKSSYGWKKVNENQYVSTYDLHLLIEVPVDKGDHSFTIFLATWSKQVYDILVRQ